MPLARSVTEPPLQSYNRKTHKDRRTMSQHLQPSSYNILKTGTSKIKWISQWETVEGKNVWIMRFHSWKKKVNLSICRSLSLGGSLVGSEKEAHGEMYISVLGLFSTVMTKQDKYLRRTTNLPQIKYILFVSEITNCSNTILTGNSTDSSLMATGMSSLCVYWYFLVVYCVSIWTLPSIAIPLWKITENYPVGCLGNNNSP